MSPCHPLTAAVVPSETPLVGGRVWREQGTWIDLACGAQVHLRVWALGQAEVGRWGDVHADALDAWVVRRSGCWMGVRVDLADQRDGGVLDTPVRIDVDQVAHALVHGGTVRGQAASPRGLRDAQPWRAVARRLRCAGITPVVGALTKLAHPSWVAACIVSDGAPDSVREQLACVTRARVAICGVVLPRAAPWQAVGLAEATGRRPAGREDAMGDAEILEALASVEGAADDRLALQALCGLLRQHLEAASVGVTSADGARVVHAGTGDPPPCEWMATVSRTVGRADLVLPEARVAALAVTDGDVGLGVLWAAWPGDTPPRPDTSRVLAAATRLAASRLAACESRGGVGPDTRHPLLGTSRAMCEVRAQLTRAARSPFPVLLLGESGCGKEVSARIVHEASARARRRFVTINCAALPDDLLEAELFGHMRGAFTGATADRPGLFEEADGGTLLLDEVGELAPRAQAKLLRVLQEQEVRRVGENVSRRVDVRLIAATNVPLERAVAERQFRPDLYYRIAVVCIRLPPLRERRDDIADLAQHLWAECRARVGSRAELSASAVRALTAYDWPGNVRELQNVLAALAVNAPRRGLVHLEPRMLAGARVPANPACEVADDLDHARREFEAKYVRDALVRAGGRPTDAARQLGLTRQGFSKLVRRLGLVSPTERSRVR
jgi:DNA-binding NtrC family response regulator